MLLEESRHIELNNVDAVKALFFKCEANSYMLEKTCDSDTIDKFRKITDSGMLKS